jgi:hypothetical protein
VGKGTTVTALLDGSEISFKQGLNLAPLTDPVATIVSAADISNVDAVLVDARVVKREGELVGVDLERPVADAVEMQLRFDEAAGWSEAGRFSWPAVGRRRRPRP